MEKWDGSNILDIARSFVNEDDLSPEFKHIEFSTQRRTFDILKESLTKDLNRPKNSVVWSRNFPKDTVHDKIITKVIDDGIPLKAPVILDLTLFEIDAINLILGMQINALSHAPEPPDELIEAFFDINHDFQSASGMVSPTFKTFTR